MAKPPLKIALVHDYLREYGGAERVLEALHELFPEAPVYTAFVDAEALGIHWQRFATWDVRESWITKIPFYKKLFSPLRLFSPKFFADFDLSDYDVVISSTNAYFAKAIKVRDGATHICYCHTPARSLYGYTTMSDWKRNPFTRVFGTLINHYLRIVDFEVAQNVTHFIANSKETQRRIKKFYKRDATVIFPPVRIPSTPPETDPVKKYYLYVNRLALAKHPELAVQACTELKIILKVVGTGKMEAYLRELGGATIDFRGAVNDKELHKLYAGAKALIYPVEDEDFGMVPVEAMGHGVPVIAHRSGGPMETITEEEHGLFFDELSVAGLKEAILLSQNYDFDAKKIWQHARQFSEEQFTLKMKEFIKKVTIS